MIGGASEGSTTDRETTITVTGSYGTRVVSGDAADDRTAAGTIDVDVDDAKTLTSGEAGARLGVDAPTVYENLIAGGATASKACALARGFDPRGCVTAAQHVARR